MKQDIRSFKGLKGRLVSWYNTLNAKSGETLVITIARKGPRLYEYGHLLSGEEAHCLLFRNTLFLLFSVRLLIGNTKM